MDMIPSRSHCLATFVCCVFGNALDYSSDRIVVLSINLQEA